jgi:predicted MPP superfamily phosphohydrolase
MAVRITPISGTALGLGAAAAGCLAYAAGYEVRAFTLRHFTIPVLPAGSAPLRVLHVSDLHFTPGQRKKRDWVRALAELEPDLVVNTGDNIAHPDAVPTLLEALDSLLRIPGVFVFGSNDYYRPRAKNPARYLLPAEKIPRVHGAELPWKEVRDEFLTAGWHDLSNTRATVRVDGRTLTFAGVDDPHIERDEYGAVRGRPDPAADLAVGVTHAPYQRVLDAMRADGYRLVLAGHTHGGQLCVPGWGALVTNCDLEPARAKGVSRHPSSNGRAYAHSDSIWRDDGHGDQEDDAAWLHVSAGLGTSPYAPVRFACRPEASLLTLVAPR